MAIDSDPPTDTIVVGGSSDGDSGRNADGSIAGSVAYDANFGTRGEDNNSAGRDQQMTEPDLGNEAYESNSDSPVQADAQEAASVLQQGEALKNLQPSDALSPASSVSSDSSPPVTEPLSPGSPSDLAAGNEETPLEGAPKPTVQDSHQEPHQESNQESRLGSHQESPDSQLSPGGGSAGGLAGNSMDVTSNAPDTSDDADADPDAIDIQKLVDDITAKAATPSSPSSSSSSSSSGQDGPSAPVLPLQPSASPLAAHQAYLPPKPALAPPADSQGAPHLYSQSHPRPDANTALSPHGGALPPFPDRAPSYPGAPGTTGAMTESLSKLPPPPAPSFGAPGSAPFGPAQSFPNSGNLTPQNTAPQNDDQAYESFIRDEQRYTREAKWERFPDGSRVFIGTSPAPSRAVLLVYKVALTSEQEIYPRSESPNGTSGTFSTTTAVWPKSPSRRRTASCSITRSPRQSWP